MSVIAVRWSRVIAIEVGTFAMEWLDQPTCMCKARVQQLTLGHYCFSVSYGETTPSCEYHYGIKMSLKIEEAGWNSRLVIKLRPRTA